MSPDPRPPPHFQWILEGKLAAFAFPSRPSHIRWLLDHNIKNLVSLQEYPDPPVKDFEPELKWTRIPIPEFHPPRLEQSQHFCRIVDESLARGEAVGVHCTFGHGRTGTVVACWLAAHFKEGWVAAIQRLRDIRPWSIETWEQELAVRSFCCALNGVEDDRDQYRDIEN